jgi:hypothetical protein
VVHEANFWDRTGPIALTDRRRLSMAEIFDSDRYSCTIGTARLRYYSSTHSLRSALRLFLCLQHITSSHDNRCAPPDSDMRNTPQHRTQTFGEFPHCRDDAEKKMLIIHAVFPATTTTLSAFLDTKRTLHNMALANHSERPPFSRGTMDDAGWDDRGVGQTCGCGKRQTDAELLRQAAHFRYAV